MNLREWALPVYTILMQLAVGAMLILWLIRTLIKSKFSREQVNRIMQNPMLVIFITVVVAMMGSHFHLSKPWHSLLAMLNFHTSWLSREIIFTVLFFITLSILGYLCRFKSTYHQLITSLGWAAIIFGFITIYCMARIYLLPTQVAWNSNSIIISFFATTLILGIMAIACLLVMDLKFAELQEADDVAARAQVIKYSIGWMTFTAFFVVVVSIATTFYQVYFLNQGDATAQTSLRLLFQLYTPLFVLRLLLISIAPLYLGYAVKQMYKLDSAPQNLFMPVYLSFLLILISENLGRFLFYATHIRVGV